MKDEKYRQFHCRLIPTVAPERVIGIRTPKLRAYAKELFSAGEYKCFLQELPHFYYEENNLHAFLLEKITDYDEVIDALDAFLPYVDNWATCDSMNPKIFVKHLPELSLKIGNWLDSEHVYTVRFGIEMLMKYYLDLHFSTVYPETVAKIRSEEYYIRMMIAWYFATALAKRYDMVLPFIEEQCLDPWTHNKTIQKAIESDRIPDSVKAYLKTLKRKDVKPNGTFNR